MTDPTEKIPTIAIVLGFGGVSPFLGLTCLTIIFNEQIFTQVLVAYAATILSFLGGIHWGVAMRSYSEDLNKTRLQNYLCLSIAPPLVAWATLLIENFAIALGILFIGFISQLVVDVKAVKNRTLPPWYNALRVPLTIIVLLCLIVVLYFNN